MAADAHRQKKKDFLGQTLFLRGAKSYLRNSTLILDSAAPAGMGISYVCGQERRKLWEEEVARQADS